MLFTRSAKQKSYQALYYYLILSLTVTLVLQVNGTVKVEISHRYSTKSVLPFSSFGKEEEWDI